MPALFKNKRFVSYIFLLINTICWGAALVIVKPALDVTTPSRYLLYRFFFAIIFSLPILFYFLPKIKNALSAIQKITILEILGTSIALPVLYTGLERTGAIEASLIATTGPIFIVLVGVWLLKEKQEKHEWTGLAVAFIGTLMISVLPVLTDTQFSKSSSNTLWGNGLILFYNLVTALYFILTKKWYRRLPKLFVSTVSFYIGFISCLGISLLEIEFSFARLWHVIQLDMQSPSVWIATLYMALFGSIIGLTAYIKGQDGIEASEASIFGYLQPLVYIPLAYVLLGEKVSRVQLLGLFVVLLGVVLAGKRIKHNRPTRSKLAS